MGEKGFRCGEWHECVQKSRVRWVYHMDGLVEKGMEDTDGEGRSV